MSADRNWPQIDTDRDGSAQEDLGGKAWNSFSPVLICVNLWLNFIGHLREIRGK